MPERIVLDRLRYASVIVNERTQWNFVEIGDDQGFSAVVETTSGGDVASRLTPLMQALQGRPIHAESDLPRIAGVTPRQAREDFALATAVSALRTAIVDIQAQRDGLPLARALDGEPAAEVDLYANTNRHLLGTDRRPCDFAATAERAVGDGFRTVKVTPFDEVDRDIPAADLVDLARPGLDRVAAVRRAVGPDIALLVDCHSRFDLASAPAVAEELAALNIGWFEEPVQPTQHPDVLAQIASRVEIPVAGGESGYGAGFFQRLVARRAVEIVMPDVKHCGGVREAVRAATLAGKPGRPHVAARSQRPGVHPGRRPRDRRDARGPAAGVRRLRVSLARRPDRADRTCPKRSARSAQRPRSGRAAQHHSPPAPRPHLAPRLSLIPPRPVHDPDVSPARPALIPRVGCRSCNVSRSVSHSDSHYDSHGVPA